MKDDDAFAWEACAAALLPTVPSCDYFPGGLLPRSGPCLAALPVLLCASSGTRLAVVHVSRARVRPKAEEWLPGCNYVINLKLPTHRGVLPPCRWNALSLQPPLVYFFSVLLPSLLFISSTS